MRVLFLAILAACTVACSEGGSTYTWGMFSDELSHVYCDGIGRCGLFNDDVDFRLCVEHTSWHLCEADRLCDTAINEAEARATLEPCSMAMSELEPEDESCYLLGYHGVLPSACSAIFDTRPYPTED